MDWHGRKATIDGMEPHGCSSCCCQGVLELPDWFKCGCSFGADEDREELQEETGKQEEAFDQIGTALGDLKQMSHVSSTLLHCQMHPAVEAAVPETGGSQ